MMGDQPLTNTFARALVNNLVRGIRALDAR